MKADLRKLFLTFQDLLGCFADEPPDIDEADEVLRDLEGQFERLRPHLDWPEGSPYR